MMYADVLAVLGLILDALGIVLLFHYAPEKYPNPQFGVGFKVEDGSVERWKLEQPKRRHLAFSAVCIIVLGFFLQAVSVIVW